MSGVASLKSRLRQILQLGWGALRRALSALAVRLRQLPRARLLLGAGCAVLLAVWGCERQARLRQTAHLHELQQQTSTTVAALEARAAAAVADANQRNAQVIHELEAKRARLEAEARTLAIRLQSHQAEQRAQTEQVATLPSAELARRVTAVIGSSESEAEKRISVDVEPPASGLGSSSPASDSPLASPALTLSEPELRSLATVLAEHDGCRAERLLVEAQFANCHAQSAVDGAIIQRQKDSLAQLNQALAAKDDLAARRDALHQAELKAARGSRLVRFGRAVRWIAVGIIIGAVIR